MIKKNTRRISAGTPTVPQRRTVTASSAITSVT